MRFEPVDHVTLHEWGPWPSALRRWQREGLGQGNSAPQYAEADERTLCGIDLWMLPRFAERVIAEDETTITKVIDRGIVQRELKSPDEMSIPEHLEYPVKTRADWDAMKKRFDPGSAGRLPADWDVRCERWRRDKPWLVFQCSRGPSLFGFVRELMGPERTLYAFYDEPQLVHDMMETITELTLAMLPRVVRDAPLTSVFFWEDMCYRAGPLISPAMFREFMIPRYRRITDLACRLGIDIMFVDCDGDVSELIPLWIEAGIRGVYPMEVAAGMDVAKLRREYGHDLLMTGGIDKRVLAQDRRAIDEELARRMPIAEQGGYIPHLDHAVPHDVPYDNFVYYWERKKAILGV